MSYSFGDITTSGQLAAILDFRHEVASAMIVGHFDVSYIVINPCIGFETTRVSVKPAQLLVLPVTWLPSWISSTRRLPTKPEVPPLDRLTPKTQVWPLEFCCYALQNSRYAWGAISPPPPLPANVAKKPLPGEGLNKCCNCDTCVQVELSDFASQCSNFKGRWKFYSSFFSSLSPNLKVIELFKWSAFAKVILKQA